MRLFKPLIFQHIRSLLHILECLANLKIKKIWIKKITLWQTISQKDSIF